MNSEPVLLYQFTQAWRSPGLPSLLQAWIMQFQYQLQLSTLTAVCLFSHHFLFSQCVAYCTMERTALLTVAESKCLDFTAITDLMDIDNNNYYNSSSSSSRVINIMNIITFTYLLFKTFKFLYWCKWGFILRIQSPCMIWGSSKDGLMLTHVVLYPLSCSKTLDGVWMTFIFVFYQNNNSGETESKVMGERCRKESRLD